MSVVDTPQREEALDPKGSFCVTAPAGSGKTELLIQRFLALLGRVTRPEQVLAITFTRKAAAEMRARVLEALEDARLNRPCEAEHEQRTRTLALAALAASDAGNWQLLQTPGALNIKTIDGFCAGLTRQMPILSQFGGQVSLVERAEPLYAEAVEDLFAMLGTGRAIEDDLTSLLLHFDNDWSKLRQLLMQLLARRDQWHDYMGAHHTAQASEQALLASVRSLVDEQLDALAQALRGFETELAALWHYANDQRGLTPVAAFPQPNSTDLGLWRTLPGLLLTAKGEWRRSVDKRAGFPTGKGEPAEYKRRMLELLAALAEVPDLEQQVAALRYLPDIESNSTSWQLVLQLSHVLPMAAACLLLVFSRRGTVDYSQVTLSALQALGEDDSPTDLALRLDYRIEHILVDEFQDTAINQYQLLHRLTRGWGEHNAANPDAPRTLFIVGDGMQSIYGFRDANVGLFLKARQQGFNGVVPRALALQCNFRSRAGVVDWVNNSFARAFPVDNDERKGQVAFTPAVAVQAAESTPAVSLHGFRGDLATEQEAAFLLSQVREALADNTVRSIAILGRSRRQLAPILAALSEAGISYAAQDMDALSGSPVVVDLLSLCRALANPADHVAWYAVLRAPWCGLTLADLHRIAASGFNDPWQWIEQAGSVPGLSADGKKRLEHVIRALQWAQSKRDRLALRVWLEQLWLHLGGPGCLEQSAQLVDAQRFFELIERADGEGVGLSIDWLRRELNGLFAAAQDPTARVQVMTLHKSKGLEFDWVLIPALGRSTRGNDRELLLWDEYISPDGDRGFLLAADDHSAADDPSLYNFLKQQRKEKFRLETTRLLYVGATRAVRRLVLSAELKVTGDPEDPSPDYRPPSEGALLHPIWNVFLEQMHEHAPLSATESATEAPAETQGSTRPALLRLHILPSQVPVEPLPEEQAANIPDRVFNRFERHVGTVIHQALEDLSAEDVLPQSVTEEAVGRWRCALAELGFHGALLDEASTAVESAVQKALSSATGRWVLDAGHHQASSEWPLTARDEQGRLRDLVIDRTFIDSDEQARWIVDYKSSRPASGETEAEFFAREALSYRAQLQAYRDALAALGETKIRCALYFTALGQLHTLEDLST